MISAVVTGIWAMKTPAYEADNGKPVWRAGRDSASYSSPILATLLGQEQIVMVNAHSVTGHNLQNGEVPWEYGRAL